MPRLMEIVTPLGDDLLFHGMNGREEMSRLFEYQLDLLSKKPEISPDDILGKNVTIKLALPDDKTRYFNGYVTRFSAGGIEGRYFAYHATVRPWLWFLTRTSDCRIFQDQTVPDIVKAVFADSGAADFKLELTGKYRKWTYCVQYRETDFNFVSRLLEQEGIAYYFRHTDGHDTMVLTDSTSKHKATPGYEKLSFIAPTQQVKPELEHVSAWDSSREIQPGVYVHRDYDFERPSVELKTSKSLPRNYKPSNLEVYDYPGDYLQKADGEQYAAVRIDELGSQFEVAQGRSNARGVATGGLLTLEDHPRAAENHEYLVAMTSYSLMFDDYESTASQGSVCQCAFVAMPSTQQFRPKRQTPKPFVQGPQTAIVVGPAGDEIYTDKYGRVKVQFHWDRYGKKDENSSCWTRVSHPWAGKGWGAVATPRIGQEVIVDFLEGDPDQPIITGRVYNAANLPPFGFPAGAVLSGIKSQTHKGAGFNELSMDDSAGKERVFIHGQYNMDTVVENNQTSTIHKNRTDVVDVDDSETVKNNQTQHVVKNQTINIDVNRKETVGGTETIAVTGHRSEKVNGGEDVTVTGSRIHTVKGLQTTTVTLAEIHAVGAARVHAVGAAELIKVVGAQIISVGPAQVVKVSGLQKVSVGAAQTVSVKAAQSTDVGAAQTLKVGAAQTVSVKANAGMTVGGDESRGVTGGRSTSVGKDDALKVTNNFVVDAGDSITIKTGDASITMKKDGTIQIKGKDITISGSGKVNVKADGDIVMKSSGSIKQN